MNKAFKVLWNHLRGSYVVASEATASHGKASRAVKTAVAAVAMVAMVGGVQAADPITNDSFGSQYDSTKFISGGGGDITIQTNGDTRQLLSAIKNFIENGNSGDTSVKNEALKKLLGALGTANDSATLVGFAGGQNVVDEGLANIFDTEIDLVVTQINIGEIILDKIATNLSQDPATQEQIKNGLLRVISQLSDTTVSQLMPSPSIGEGDIRITIGGNGSKPLLVGSVGADRLVNIGLGVDNKILSGSAYSAILNRVGNVQIEAESGNFVSFLAGSSAININGISGKASVITAPLTGGGASVVLDGSTSVQLTGSTTSAAMIAGGSAMALGGNASSTVTGSSSIVIDTQTKGSGFDGINVGVLGGGLSVATLGGQSSAIVGDAENIATTSTSISLEGGVSGLVMGGGMAAAAEISQIQPIVSGIGGIGDNIGFDEDLLHQGGTAYVESQDVSINVGSSASVFGLMGGGTAVAYQVENATKASTATAVVNDVTITLGEKDAKPVFADVEEKGKYFEALKGALSLVQNSVPAGEDVGIKDTLLGVVNGLAGSETQIQGYIDTIAANPGVTVGVLGGGIAASWAREATGAAVTTPVAKSTVNSVTLNVLSGYNVGLVGGGLAMASAPEAKNDGEALVQNNAIAEVTEGVTINLLGGETIGVMGGGIAAFSGTAEQNNGVGALSDIRGEVAVNVGGEASVDGIVLGGLAIDDTNPTADGLPTGDPVSKANVASKVQNATLTAASGAIGYLNFAAFVGKSNESPNIIAHERPDVRDHLDALAYAVEHQRVGIIGGGLASGIHDDNEAEGIAHVGETNIILRGDVKVGTEDSNANVFGGGIAVNGAKATVKKATIAVAENAEVYGNIYGGGIAQDGNYAGSPEYYNASQSVVTEAQIWLSGGEVHGDVYAGGVVGTAEGNVEQSTSTVEKGLVVLENDQVFQGTVIDGSGAEESTLQFQTNDYSFKDGQRAQGFDYIVANTRVKNLNYTFVADGDKQKELTVTGAPVEFASVNGFNAVFNVGENDSEGIEKGTAVIHSLDEFTTSTMNVRAGVLALGEVDGQTVLDAVATAPGSAEAMAYVTGAVDLTSNSLIVGNVADQLNPGLAVGSNGMLVADAAGSTNVSGTTNFADGSSIHFVNVADGQTVTIGSEGQEATVGTTVDNVLYTVTQTGNSYTFVQRTSEQLDEVGLGDVDTSFLEGLDGQDNPGADYIYGFLDESASGVTNGNRGQQLKAAMNLASAAGVQTMAIDGTMMGIEAANKRASIINNFVDGGKLFAELTGKHSEMGGGSGFGEIESDLGGLVVGGEYTANDWTFGALANLGTGSVDGKGDNSGVENDVDYYGIQAYAGKRFGQFNLVGQVGYLMSENDISHSTIGSNTADVDADVWTIGLRGEMRFELSDTARMVPYVGINYLRISTDGYTTSQGVKVDDVDQDLWTTPVGVKFAGDFESNSGWVLSPSLDVAYIPAFGDTDVDAKTDVGVVGHTSMDVWSDSVGRAKLGISAQKDNLGIGLEIGGAAGADDFTEYFGQVRVDYRF